MRSTMKRLSVRPGKLRTATLTGLLLFMTGMMTMVHLITLLPYVLYIVVIGGMLALYLGRSLGSRGLRMGGNLQRYLCWYGLFTLLVVLSLLYTVNTVNPDYAVKRVAVTCCLGLLTAGLVRTRDHFRILANGLIAGSFFVVAAALVFEGFELGMGRLGKMTVGSAVSFSGIMLVGCICAQWRAVSVRHHRRRFAAMALFLFAMILLSGSRRAMLVAMLMLMLQLMLSREIRKSRKVLLLLAAATALCVFVYLLFTNKTLYAMIGWRIESMLQTVLGSAQVEDASMLERSAMKDYGYRLFRERPVAGWGVHGFAYKFNGFYGKLLYSHCGFSEILSCYGLIGFVLFYQVFVRYALRARRVLKSRDGVQVLMLVYALLTLISESGSMAFLTPQVVVMLTAGMNLMRLPPVQARG